MCSYKYITKQVLSLTEFSTLKNVSVQTEAYSEVLKFKQSKLDLVQFGQICSHSCEFTLCHTLRLMSWCRAMQIESPWVRWSSGWLIGQVVWRKPFTNTDCHTLRLTVIDLSLRPFSFLGVSITEAVKVKERGSGIVSMLEALWEFLRHSRVGRWSVQVMFLFSPFRPPQRSKATVLSYYCVFVIFPRGLVFVWCARPLWREGTMF